MTFKKTQEFQERRIINSIEILLLSECLFVVGTAKTALHTYVNFYNSTQA